MNCQKAQIMINKYLDGQLDPDSTARLFEHLQNCPSCRLQYEQLTEVDQLLKEQFAPMEPPAGFAESVMAALPDNATSGRVVPIFRRSKRLQRYALSAVAAVMMLVGISYFGFSALVADNDQNPPSVSTAQGTDTPTTSDQPATQPQDNQTVDVTTPQDNTATQDNTSQNNNSEENATPQDTQEAQGTDEGTPQQSVVSLPKVAYNSEVSGSFSLQVLAEHEGMNAIYPQVVDADTVRYYVKNDDDYQLWQQTLSAAQAPVMIEDHIKTLPVVEAATTQTNDIFSEDGSKVVAMSPDSAMVAANVYKDEVGLWLSDNYSEAEPYILTHKAGGKILVWSPNSGKIAYTDAEGHLYVAYPSENISFLVYEGAVKSVCWDSSSNVLVFAAKAESSDYTGIYKVVVP